MKKSQMRNISIAVFVVAACIAFGTTGVEHSSMWAIGSTVIAFAFSKVVDTMEEDQ